MAINVTIQDGDGTISATVQGGGIPTHGSSDHDAEVLHDGQDFDGQGSSAFSNLQSVGADELSSDTPTRDPNAEAGIHPRAGRDKSLTHTAYGRPDEAAVCWIFDDAYDDVYEHRDVFANKNVKAAIAVPTNKVGNSGRMTWSQIQELYEDYGWGVMSHGYNEVNFSSATDAEIEEEVKKSYADLLEHGITPSPIFAYVGGATNGETGKGIVSDLYDYGRGTGANAFDQATDPYQVPSKQTDNEDTAVLEGLVDTAVSTPCALFFNGHHIIQGTRSDETSSPLTTSTGKIKNIIDYARNNGATWYLPSETAKRTVVQRVYGRPDGGNKTLRGNANVRETLAAGAKYSIYGANNGRLMTISENGDWFWDPTGSFYTDLPSGAAKYVRDSAGNNIWRVNEGGGAIYKGSLFQMDPSRAMRWTPKDVRQIDFPSQGDTAFHDGTNGNTVGPAFYDGSAWISTVDGTTIS